MIDFNKILNETPEEKEAREQRMQERYAQLEAEEARMKLMVDKLYDQMARGCINNDWAETFIESVHARIASGLPLSDRQRAKVEELFERY